MHVPIFTTFLFQQWCGSLGPSLSLAFSVFHSETENSSIFLKFFRLSFYFYNMPIPTFMPSVLSVGFFVLIREEEVDITLKRELKI